MRYKAALDGINRLSRLYCIGSWVVCAWKHCCGEMKPQDSSSLSCFLPFSLIIGSALALARAQPHRRYCAHAPGAPCPEASCDLGSSSVPAEYAAA